MVPPKRYAVNCCICNAPLMRQKTNIERHGKHYCDEHKSKGNAFKKPYELKKAPKVTLCKLCGSGWHVVTQKGCLKCLS